ncbi:uncharacterized protein NDAI_0C02550 [Naumovozyma dairenensis CBS 421]|uniref:Uncharacterized protein n=1 Tax=Naumovozyma dairenensis (strain ATCC 10597 / BCRC 20456 / CBS 421 / NBRC 0211 / NRRL Y-12639) TaxID=1071378 RepID=G0W804_NAUDC|nr:hypothetical protein NDAI_0C02550 [Naumovozyma dairenensis CBS 421]CCD23915.1 hypothetical protein NDAI_0C02550 [Naumovozyma dairenensis CBS 421]
MKSCGRYAYLYAPETVFISGQNKKLSSTFLACELESKQGRFRDLKHFYIHELRFDGDIGWIGTLDYHGSKNSCFNSVHERTIELENGDLEKRYFHSEILEPFSKLKHPEDISIFFQNVEKDQAILIRNLFLLYYIRLLNQKETPSALKLVNMFKNPPFDIFVRPSDDGRDKFYRYYNVQNVTEDEEYYYEQYFISRMRYMTGIDTKEIKFEGSVLNPECYDVPSSKSSGTETDETCVVSDDYKSYGKSSDSDIFETL